MAEDSQGPALVVFTTPRSGSNFLGSLILQTWSFGWFGEWMNPEFEAIERQRYGVAPEAGPAAYLRVVADRRGTPGKGWSIKLMPEHWEHLLRQFRETQGVAAPPDAVLAALFPRAVPVFLFRRDVVRQAVSLVKARQSGVWRQFSGAEKDPERPVSYQFDEIDEAVNRIGKWNTSWEDLFREARLDPMRICYEEFQSDPVAFLERIFAEAGIHFPEERIRLSRSIRRQSDPVNSEWISHYTATAAARTAAAGKPIPALCKAGLEAVTIAAPSFIEARPGQVLTVPCGIFNGGTTTLLPWNGAGNAGRFLLLATEAGSGRVLARNSVPKPLTPGMEADISLRLDAPAIGGLLHLGLTATQEGHGETGKICSATLWVRPCQRAFRALQWLPDAPFLSETAVRLPVLGEADVARFPWIRHPRYGWLRLFPGSGMEILWLFYPGWGLLCLRDGADGPVFMEPDSGFEWCHDPTHSPENRFIRVDGAENRIIPFPGHPFPVASMAAR